MKLRDDRGFTMAELLVVVLILGIIGALVIPKYAAQPEKARLAVVQADLKTIKAALEVYQIENPAAGFPGISEVNGVLQEYGIKWTGDEHGIRDPWGGPYHYLVNGEQFVVTSTGQKDGKNWYITEQDDPTAGHYPAAGWGANVSRSASESQ